MVRSLDAHCSLSEIEHDNKAPKAHLRRLRIGDRVPFALIVGAIVCATGSGRSRSTAPHTPGNAIIEINLYLHCLVTNEVMQRRRRCSPSVYKCAFHDEVSGPGMTPFEKPCTFEQYSCVPEHLRIAAKHHAIRFRRKRGSVQVGKDPSRRY